MGLSDKKMEKMKECIWCSRTEISKDTTFNNKAHTIPKALGGKQICENVCDSCNSFFGSPKKEFKGTSIEIALKEVLNLSKYLLLQQIDQPPKNEKFKSQFFNLNFLTSSNKYSIETKPRYGITKGFQELFGTLFRRGLYKVFLEERERQEKDGHNAKFDFIRAFARYGLGDCPIYVLKPKFEILHFSVPDTLEPTIRFTEHSKKEEKEFGIYSYIIQGHTFCIPTSKFFEDFSIERYKKHLIDTNNTLGTELIPIKYAEDIDFTFRYMED